MIKSPLFELLEGTRALEVLNTKLDTGIIDLNTYDIKFDCAAAQEVDSIINVQTHLLCQLVNWLENNSLPVSVLSCRYVQTLLVNHSQSRFHNLKTGCAFRDSRIREQVYQKNFKYWAVHKILKTFVRALCKFIGFMLDISRKFLYDEEDIMTRAMDLDFLLDVSPLLIIEEIDTTIEWILGNDIVENSGILISQLKIVQSLNRFEECVLSLLIPFMDKDASLKGKEELCRLFSFCKDVEMHLERVRAFQYDEETIPKGAFSRFIQADLDNPNIPVDVAKINISHSLDHISEIFRASCHLVTQVSEIKSISQLQDYLHYNIRYPSTDFSVFTRALFQQYFIRDDKSIFGSPSTDLTKLTTDIVENVIGDNTIMLHNLNTRVAQLKDSMKREILERHLQVMQDLEGAIYHNLCIYGANPGRSQQLVSKGLVIWDTLQVSWQTFERQLYDSFQIYDPLEAGIPSLSVTMFIYFQKVQMMLDLLLNGIDLELYKPFEIYMVYLYADTLLNHLINHIKTPLRKIVLAKIDEIEINMPKKIKKLKNGPKKDALKTQHNYGVDVTIPRLLHTIKYQDYMVDHYTCMDKLVTCYSKFCAVLAKLRLIDFSRGPTKNMSSMEHLYYLRMKPWSSIGVPEFPSYAQYQHELIATRPDANNRVNLTQCLKLLTEIKLGLHEVEKGVKSILNYVSRNGEVDFIKQSKIKEWYERLAEAGNEMSLEVSSLGKIVSEHNDDLLEIPKQYRLVVERGKHAYFLSMKTVTKNE